MKLPVESGVYFEARILATSVKFDVAVTAEAVKRGELGGGLQISIVSAKAGGEITTTNTTANRIQSSLQNRD
jgi:hypothetical protein